MISTEILITFGIILFLLFIAGASIDFLTGTVLIILTAALGIIALFFLFFSFVLISSKKKTAYFTRFGSLGESKIENAVYTIDGQEYFNVFPKEVIFTKKLYKENKPVNVRLTRNKLFVLDANAVTTIIAGDAAVVAMLIVFAPTIAGIITGAFFLGM
ncbi:MAG: hypothetical protein ACI4KM_04750 [Oscillospiraceae bacterium]